jgi:Rieske Fe-S protein
MHEDSTPGDPTPGGQPAGPPAATRRAILAGAGGAGLAAGLAGLGVALAGCTTYGKGSGGQRPDTNAGAGRSAGAVLAKVADIPVGGGKVFEAEQVVVTQPQQGTIKAFSAVCTHEGCTVVDVSSDTINCPCHGSRFAVADGAVVQGPAPRPLPAVEVTVDGDSIKLA